MSLLPWKINKSVHDRGCNARNYLAGTAEKERRSVNRGEVY